jgi:periplasmic protein TonB
VDNVSSNTNKYRALAISLFFHAGLLLILIYTFLTTPDPPLTGGEGMVVNLGYVDESTGDIQPMSESEAQPIITAEEISASIAKAEEEKILTQENEATEEVKVNENADAETKENDHQNVTEENKNQGESNVKAVEEVKKEEPKVNPLALYKGQSNNSTSQGNSNKGTGDQGDPNGDPNATNYGKNTGDGNNPGDGKGISFSLAGRRMIAKPQIQDNSQEEGKVVVDIIVDRSGKVIKATPGARGSTTTSTHLYNKAKQSALNAKFSARNDGPEEQKGNITFVFILD